MKEHFNSLNPGQHERLSCLSEELGESQQIVGKIPRHGLNSYHPDDLTVSNRMLLAKELGHVQYAIQRLLNWEDISGKLLEKHKRKSHQHHILSSSRG